MRFMGVTKTADGTAFLLEMDSVVHPRFIEVRPGRYGGVDVNQIEEDQLTPDRRGIRAPGEAPQKVRILGHLVHPGPVQMAVLEHALQLFNKIFPYEMEAQLALFDAPDDVREDPALRMDWLLSRGSSAGEALAADLARPADWQPWDFVMNLATRKPIRDLWRAYDLHGVGASSGLDLDVG